MLLFTHIDTYYHLIYDISFAKILCTALAMQIAVLEGQLQIPLLFMGKGALLFFTSKRQTLWWACSIQICSIFCQIDEHCERSERNPL